MEWPLPLFWGPSYDSINNDTTLLDFPVLSMLHDPPILTELDEEKLTGKSEKLKVARKLEKLKVNPINVIGVAPQDIAPNLFRGSTEAIHSSDSVISSTASTPTSSSSSSSISDAAIAITEEQEDEEEEVEPNENKDEDYTPRSSNRKLRSSYRKMKLARSKPYDPKSPSKEPEIMSKTGKEVIEDFKMGANENESVSAFQRRILKSAKNYVIIDHVRKIGAKICSDAREKELDGQELSGDYLARMRGCLRNAAVGLFLITHLLDHAVPFDKDLLIKVLSCVPPQSTRPTAKKARAKLPEVQAQLGIKEIPNTVELFWIENLRPEDREYMRNHVHRSTTANPWPGTWDKLPL